VRCRSCREAVAAMQRLERNGNPQAIPLPGERVARHTSHGSAEAAGVFSHWHATGQWPGEPAPDGSSGMRPGTEEAQPVEISLSAMPLGTAAVVLSEVPGYGYLQRDPQQVWSCAHVRSSSTVPAMLCTFYTLAETPVRYTGGGSREAAWSQGVRGCAGTSVQVSLLPADCLQRCCLPAANQLEAECRVNWRFAGEAV
jgi:hypothetical protein